MLNQDMVSQKKLVESVFDTVAEGYGTLEYVRHFGQRLVDRAGLRKGMKVLDVACGRGAILIPAAEAVGRGGLAVGIDLAVEMIDQTYVEVRQRDLDQAIMFHMDAEALDFDSDTFDVVLCGFGLFFFPHLERALAEFMRVLKPGGTLAVSTWDAGDPAWEKLDTMITKYTSMVKVRSWDLSEVQELRLHLSMAGFTNVSVISETYDAVMPDEGGWWKQMWAISQRATLEQMTQETLVRFKAAYLAELGKLRQPDGIHQKLTAHLAVARKAGA
jgi:ubiquinone/menaquinone biosynthesis C-methylase UbiE